MDADGTKFWEWLKANDVQINDKVELHDFSLQGQGRGVIAKDDIAKGELIFSIPTKFVMAAENDKEFGKLIEKHDNGEWLNLMSFMMVCEQRVHWKPYFDVLPKQFNTPMFWDPSKAKKLLQGSALVDKIGKEEAEEQWWELKSLYSDEIFKGCDTSVDNFHRMGSLIMSYSFDVEHNEEPMKAMCPPADMLNAHTKLCNAHLHHTDDESDCFEMKATKNIKKGDQVYNTYGELPNSDLLRRYGYVEQGGTDYDVVEIPTSLIITALTQTGAIKSEQDLEQIVAEMEQDEDDEFFDDAYDVGVTGEPDLPMLVMMEYLGMVLETDNTQRLQKQVAKLVEDEKLTKRGKDVLIKLCELRLAQYPEDIQSFEDNEEKENSSETLVETEPESMAREVLQGEVRILRRCISWATEIDTVNHQTVLDKVYNPSKKQKTK